MEKETNGHLYILNDNIVRIANAMEEILRLVKEDQAQYKKEPEQSWPTGLGKEENAKEKN